MEIREMRKTDIAYVIPIYLDYYNNCEDGCWTIEKAQRRINQVVCMEDAYSLILENKGNVIGFAMGYFKQYDDIIGYTLEEILIASPYQHQGIGSWFAGSSVSYNGFLQALLLGDAEAMNADMNRVALATFSFFDVGKKPFGTADPERFYRSFVLGLMAELSDKYVITSNRESGFGRYDVMLEPRKASRDDAVIMEFKVQGTKEKELSDTVSAVLRQIDEKDYQASLMAKGMYLDIV